LFGYSCTNVYSLLGFIKRTLEIKIDEVSGEILGKKNLMKTDYSTEESY